MAKKRLNKKVALIGSLVFVLLVLAAICVFLYLSRDPHKFIKDGDAAWLAKDYDRAERCYGRARGLARTDSLKKEVLFKAADMYVEADRWRHALGCWQEIIRIDPQNAKARYAQLTYVYVMADSGVRQVWQEVSSQASEFIELAADSGLLMQETGLWDPFGPEGGDTAGQRLGPYLYLVRGRATFEIANKGGVTDQEESLLRAIQDLEKVLELDPNNVDAYWYLAQAVMAKGELLAKRGVLEEREQAEESALKLLGQGVESAGVDPMAHIYLLSMKLALAQKSVGLNAKEQIPVVEPLEAEYSRLVEKFPSRAEAYSALSSFYDLLAAVTVFNERQGSENLDKAIMAGEKAVELDNENVAYERHLANLYYRKFSIYDECQAVHEAIATAKRALTLPDAQDQPGPREWASRRNRILLYLFLAHCYTEQVLEPCEVSTDAQKQEWLAEAEQVVHEIEQLFGTGEAPEVVKWQGMLELAQGDRDGAVRKLYKAYEQIKASRPVDQRDPQLAYTLANVFRDSSEVGAVIEFLRTAINARIQRTKSEAYLDLADALLKVGGIRQYLDVFGVANSFVKTYGADERAQVLRIKANIGIGPIPFVETEQGIAKFEDLTDVEKELAKTGFERAEEELASRSAEDPNTVKLKLALVWANIGQLQRALADRQKRERTPEVLRQSEQENLVAETSEQLTAELQSHLNTFAELVGKLLPIEPNSVGEEVISGLCSNYIERGALGEASNLVSRFLGYFPESRTALYYKRILSEPEPGKLSQQRRLEIEEQILSEIADTTRRAMSLGAFYRRNDEPEKAIEEYKKVLGSHLPGNESVTGLPSEDEAITSSQRQAAGQLFQIALAKQDWGLAEQITELARRENIDGCEGQFFAAHVGVGREQYEDALAKLDECVRQKPVFSQAFMLRSRVNAALGNEHASIVDAQKAVSLNPLDGDIAKILALALYKRNERLGDNVSTAQVRELWQALDRARRLNPRDFQLLSLYAEYLAENTEHLSPDKPDEAKERALAIRQGLQEAAPSMQNALLLGRLAMGMAQETRDRGRKEAFFTIAASSFEQARKIDPQNRDMLLNYAEYYRVRGEGEKAEQLLAESKDQRLLWGHYLRSGKFDDAREVLLRLYEGEARDSDVIRALMFVAERTGDREAAEKYSRELLLLEDSADNRLVQIQTFLRLGLIKEAEDRLQSFKEKYPDESRAMLVEAWLAMRLGQLDRALKLTNQSLETNQDNSVAWWLRGEINLLMLNADQAVIDLRRSKLLADEPLTRISLAKAYREAGRVEEAITELKSTINDPQAPMVAWELLERTYMRLKRKRALKEFYDETLQKFPDNVLWYNRAAAFALEENDLGRAERLYEQAWQKSKKDGKGDANAFGGYLQALLSGGKLNQVFTVAQECVEGDFAPIAFCKMAEAKLRMADKAAAVQYCRKALRKAGENETFAGWVLGRMYSLLGGDEVLRACEERLEANPDSLAANYAMFHVVRINGEYNKAIGYVDKCIEIVGPDDQRRFGYVSQKAMVLQLAFEKTSDNAYIQTAIAEYESLVAKVSNRVSGAPVLNNFAYMLAENDERLVEALEYAKRAHEVKPNDPSFLDTYAFVLYKNGRFSEAAEFMLAALQQYEQSSIVPSPYAYEHLGMIKEKLGAVAEAIGNYRKALEVGGGELPEGARQRINTAIERLSQESETKT